MLGHAEVKGPYIIVFRKRLLRYPLSNGRLLILALFHRQVVTRVGPVILYEKSFLVTSSNYVCNNFKLDTSIYFVLLSQFRSEG